MKVFRIWRVQEALCGKPDHPPYRLRGWGGSNASVADAEQMATMRLAWLKEQVQFTQHGPKAAAMYEYGSGAIREEWLQLLAGTDEAPEAVVTRNRYGAPVLNASSLAMIDVDLPDEAPSRGFAFWRTPVDPALETIDNLREWQRKNPRVALRVYRTPKGFRLLRIDAEVAADSAEAQRLLSELGNDALYAALCRRQACFRGRLGPKPWRAQLPLPPARFPREGDDARKFSEWLAVYERVAAGFAACRYLETLGEDAIAGTLRRLVSAHDELSGALTDRPLA